jgi:redox-sensitive bicupin YhaK (pirin superfamily)
MVRSLFKQSESGVCPHPHRGFSPVTFVFKGGARHQDSICNNDLSTSEHLNEERRG